jgi:hypothetical protein
MSIFNFCETPRTMAEILEEGFTRDQVYNNVKRGRLVNLLSRDAWGRSVHQRRGLFQSSGHWDGVFGVRAHGVKPRFDSSALVSVWGGAS